MWNQEIDKYLGIPVGDPFHWAYPKCGQHVLEVVQVLGGPVEKIWLFPVCLRVLTESPIPFLHLLPLLLLLPLPLLLLLPLMLLWLLHPLLISKYRLLTLLLWLITKGSPRFSLSLVVDWDFWKSSNLWTMYLSRSLYSVNTAIIKLLRPYHSGYSNKCLFVIDSHIIIFLPL